MASITLPAYAKINLDLRILGVRPDGYHDLRTMFQSLALHDSLTFTARKGSFHDRVRRSAAADRPAQSGLEGGVAPVADRRAASRGDAPGCRGRLAEGDSRSKPDWAAGAPTRPSRSSGSHASGSSTSTCRPLSRLAARSRRRRPVLPRRRHGARPGPRRRHVSARRSAALRGRDRAPALRRVDRRGLWLVRQRAAARRSASRRAGVHSPTAGPEWATNLRNDLEPPVTRHHPTIGRIKQALVDAGAVVAAMSGSGSTVFGLFERPRRGAAHGRPTWPAQAGRS